MTMAIEPRRGGRLAALLLALSMAGGQAAALERLEEEFQRSSLLIVTATECLHFEVFEAATDRQRARGLMFVETLPRRVGMLFRFPAGQQPAMWMRNTYIPLDMLFISEDGEVVEVAPDAQPHSLQTITTDVPSRYVLELNGGLAAELGIRSGDRVRHRWLE